MDSHRECGSITLQEDFAKEALGLSESVSIEIFPLEGRGSDRTFSRLRWSAEHSAILINYDPTRMENSFCADIAVFLHNINIPVPRLIRHDPVRYLILFEDLGDEDLLSFRKFPWEKRLTLYQKTLIIANRLHSFQIKDFPSQHVMLMEGFDPGLYRWEQDYFRDHFVREVCGSNLEPSFGEELEEELTALAVRLSNTVHSLVHRDLQSQNVMIRDGEPYLIDFQGMRFGNPFYDLGSLLCDPYVEFNGDQRANLLLYYYNLSKQDLSWEDFQKMFWEASAQRLMQALGAYGFLGLKKGLKSYLKHIPAGVRNLHLATSQVASLPCLQKLSMECQKAIERKGLAYR